MIEYVSFLEGYCCKSIVKQVSSLKSLEISFFSNDPYARTVYRIRT